MIFVYLLSWLISPLLSLVSVIFKTATLPWPFYYFYTNDDDLDGGQHQLGWPLVTGVKLWWQRTLWIIRNPGYGFAAYVLGFKTEGMSILSLVEVGDPITGFADGRTFSSRIWMMAANGKTYFSYRRNQHLFGNRYIKIWFGWNYIAYDGEYHMFKCMFNPFRKSQI